jgi:hypothetical protein
VIEEGGDQRGVDVLDVQPVRGGAGALLREDEQQPDVSR